MAMAGEHDPGQASALNQRSLAALEWNDLLDLLSRGCCSAAGRKAMRELRLCDSLAESRLAAERIASLLELADQGSELPRAPFRDATPVFERLARAASLSGAELHDLLSVLVQARKLRVFAGAHGELHPELCRVIASEAALDRVAERIDRAIDVGGEVSDGASPALARARARVRETERDLRRLLKSLVARYASVLSGEYFSEREGRYVLPVRTDAHERVHGTVVGSSSSGSTLFVEPREVLAQVNQLRVHQAEVEREVFRVLSELAAVVKERLEAVEVAFRACVVGDLLGALLDWARRSRSLPLMPGSSAVLDLKQARHPLLAESPDVVANDLRLGGGQALVISGPNAGGKTVALKTLGLFALMARAGVPVPCEPGSSIGFFGEVLADIGDQQSLVHSLSTFSGHIQKLSAILQKVGPGSLVLLDEVVAGTDPEEGAALAGAVLEALADLGAAVAVTTHYERLKEQAAGAGPLGNACVGFDFERMQPTFRLTLGTFGPSSALLVASRFGLEPKVIERAKALLPAQARERERVARELDSERHRLHDLADELKAEQTRLELLDRQLKAERRRMSERLEAELRRESEQLRGEVLKARREIQDARKRLRSEPEARRSLSTLERQVSGVAAKLAIGGSLTKALPTRADGEQDAVQRKRALDGLAKGDPVRVRATGAFGSVLEPPSRGTVKVRVGAVRLNVPLEQLEAVPKTSASAQHSREWKRPLPARGEPDRARRTTDNTLDLRGTRIEDAEECLLAFVDRLLGKGEEHGFVLHGHGTGALRAFVRDYLDESEWIESVAPADKDEGGDAFTVFHLASR